LKRSFEHGAEFENLPNATEFIAKKPKKSTIAPSTISPPFWIFFKIVTNLYFYLPVLGKYWFSVEKNEKLLIFTFEDFLWLENMI
jgi:hypothetical protein